MSNIKVRTCIKCNNDFQSVKVMKADLCEPCRLQKFHIDFLTDGEKLKVKGGKCAETNCAVCVRKLHKNGTK